MPTSVTLQPHRLQRGVQQRRIHRAVLAQQQPEYRPRASAGEIGQQRIDRIRFRARHAAADSTEPVEIVAFFYDDAKGLAHRGAVFRPSRDADLVRAVAQAARWAMEGEAAANRIVPVGEGRAHVLPGKTVMTFAQALAVHEDVQAGDAGPGQHPAFDRQTADHRRNSDAAIDRRAVELKAKLIRLHGFRYRVQRRRTDGRQDRGDGDRIGFLLALTAAYDQTDAVPAAGGVQDTPLEHETGADGRGNVRILPRDIEALLAVFGVPDAFAIQVDLDRGNTPGTGGPTAHGQAAVLGQCGRIAEHVNRMPSAGL